MSVPSRRRPPAAAPGALAAASAILAGSPGFAARDGWRFVEAFQLQADQAGIQSLHNADDAFQHHVLCKTAALAHPRPQLAGRRAERRCWR